jgi:hypothetical protein
MSTVQPLTPFSMAGLFQTGPGYVSGAEGGRSQAPFNSPTVPYILSDCLQPENNNVFMTSSAGQIGLKLFRCRSGE